MLPTELSWNTLVLLPKGNTDTREVVLLEFQWKAAKGIIDTQIKTAVMFHDALHGFSACRGTVTAIMELNIDQELASIDQELLFLALLDIQNAYGTLGRGRIFQNLEGTWRA